MTEQPDLFKAARLRRDVGIERAGEHADREGPAHPPWREQAARIIYEFAVLKGEPFLMEEVVEHARKIGFPDPPDGRAWGSATMTAKSLDYIESCGTRRAKTSNLSPKVLWRLKKV